MQAKIDFDIDTYKQTFCIQLWLEESKVLSGRVLDLKSKDHGLRLTACTKVCPLARHFILCLVLIQPRKTGNPHEMTAEIVDWDVKHQHTQKEKNCDYFLTHQFKHVFSMLKRTISMGRFFRVPSS